MIEYKILIMQILEVIGYKEDKDRFTADFLRNVYLSAFLDLVETLPQDKQEILSTKLSENKEHHDQIYGIMKEYFPEVQMHKTLQKNALDAIRRELQKLEDEKADA